MRDRVKSVRRVMQVQKHMHALEELKYARLHQQLQECTSAQEGLTNALSTDDALHGLFMDVTVKRLQSLRIEEGRLRPLVEAQARVLREHGARLKSSERLAEDLEEELSRLEERDELERLLEAGFARRGASSEQDD